MTVGVLVPAAGSGERLAAGTHEALRAVPTPQGFLRRVLERTEAAAAAVAGSGTL